MSVRERISKLEAILARVTARASVPREANGAGVAVEVPTDLAATTEMPADDPILSTEALSPREVDVEVSERTEEAPMVAEVALHDPVARVEDIESRERIIAAPEREAEAAPISDEPVSSEAAEVRSEEMTVEVEVSEGPELTASEVADLADLAEAGEEEPPASSRRPIAVEPKLEELAFGEGAPVEPGPHTPPPESGRQIAGPPVDLDFEGEFTGVRPREPVDVSVTVVSDAPKTLVEAAPVPLAPEPIAAKLPVAATASFTGSAVVFKPATFGELLDATLSL